MVKLALLWHMHQPFYEDLATGEHILPWVRLHATKDYWGMVAIVGEFPSLRTTFNLVPSLLVQVEAFAEDRAMDRQLLIGLKPANLLTDEQRQLLISNGFHAPVDRAIRVHPRYAELYEKRDRPTAFSVADLRDLQVLHKLVWMDPDWLVRDERLVALVAKGRDYSEDDKQRLREVELTLLRSVIPAYRAAAATGLVELTTSPFYHPILPLLCDSDAHLRAHPHSALPRRLFAYPSDAQMQLARALEYHTQMFGVRPSGVWPSEGSVSDAVLGILADQGVRWAATDEEILARSLGRRVTAGDLYRPYEVDIADRVVRLLFRDHQLSDLIGFAYQSWDADAAAADFLAKVRDAGRRFADESGGEDAVVCVILDGENAWEHYAGGGRPFLRALYRSLVNAPDIETVTMSEAAALPARALTSVFPGSWINGDFYIWAGHRDDHRAWGQLAAARRTYEEHHHAVDSTARTRALEELLIAEGSDWFWWYGDDHSSDHDREFDDLFRRHVRNVYRELGQSPPDDLYVTNISTGVVPAGPLTVDALASPPLTGRSTDFLFWAAAVEVPLGVSGGTMHRVAGQLLRRVQVTADLDSFSMRVEGADLVKRVSDGEARLLVLQDRPHTVRVTPDWITGDVLMTRLAFSTLRLQPGDRSSLSLLLTDAAGHVLEQHPQQPVEILVPSADHAAVHWSV